ncbi:MAG: hypothetical protein PHN38_08935 [Sulfurospirillaceae bacterium]|nr:hypothetical protein [Sulfurospirillaceae bacterium]
MEIINFRNLILILIVVVTINYFRSNTIETEDLYLPIDTKILVISDDASQKDGGYPSHLSQILKTEVFTENISTWQGKDALTTLSQALDARKPNILIIHYGLVDVNRGKNLTDIQNNLNQMITLAKNNSVYVLLIGMPTNEILKFTTHYLYTQIATQNNIDIEDSAMAYILNDSDYKKTDLQPNSKGNEYLAQEIAKKLTLSYTPVFKPL